MYCKRFCKILSVAAVVAVAIVLVPGLVEKASKLIDTLTPPDLPEYTRPEKARWLDQNWSADDRFWFHHASQGTSTLPVPYEWFVALEQPRIWFFGDPPMLKDSAYLGRFGFIPSPVSLETAEQPLADYGYLPEAMEAYSERSFAYNTAKFAGNKDELPVGFARLETESLKDPTTGRKLLYDQIGFTCAACHTGQLEFDGITLLIDGAPAVTDLGKLRKALGVALIYTDLFPSFLGLFPSRFDRFADKVFKALGQEYTPEDKAKLKEELAALLEKGKKLKEITDPVSEHDIDEGFTRLDALNRIGNTVFFNDLMEWNSIEEKWIEAASGVKTNFVPLTAPVNYPQIWDTSWFEWVQYDASIMQPMVRNAGEALGVSAKINLTKPGPSLYRSLVQLGEIDDLERLLAGKKNPLSGEPGFEGLLAPKWPEEVLGPFDDDEKIESEKKRNGGRKLYAELCQGCHLPPVNDPGWLENDPTAAKFWDPRFWTAPNAAKQSYLKFTKFDPVSKPKFANLVAVGYVGTDPAQAEVMVERQVRTPIYLGIDPQILCNGTPHGAVDKTSFPAALAVVVEKTATKWYDEHDTPPSERERMNGYRSNCIKGEMYYKARPLDGIWATAPFLHNGAVPNLYDLLSPVNKRPETFYLGSRLFDPKKVGYVTEPIDGGFELDTTKPGNSNKGHEFRDGPRGDGVIGRFLQQEEREALVEYLKSL